MSALYTCSWRTLFDRRDDLDVLPVRMSRGVPKFWAAAEGFPALADLMPEPWMLGIKDLEKFGRCYRRKLHTIGLEAIQAQLYDLVDAYQRPLALACFETDPNECHRGPAFGFARWWQERTGQRVPEIENLTWPILNPGFGQLRLDLDQPASRAPEGV